MVCEFEGRTLPFVRERPYQLLAVLAARAGWVERDELAALFWPRDDAGVHRRNLRRVLHAARRLECGAGLEARGPLLRWPVATDVAEFDRAIREGRPADAAALLRGELAAGLDDPACVGFSDWLALERARVAAQWREAALSTMAASPPAEALALVERLLDADAFDDRALRAKLDALAALGRRGEARRAYRRFAEHLAQELGVEPDAATRAVAAALEADAPALPDRSSGRAHAVDPLIGREEELVRVLDALQGGARRLVTLTGPGGVGKTSLAREVAARAGARFADGALWADLDDLSSPREVPLRIAALLGLSPQADALQQVVQALRESRRLLVLDNCEHLADGAQGVGAVVETLLAQAPRLAVLATSRVPLRLDAEHRMPLDGLARAAGGAEIDAVLAGAAARLFCTRAATVQPAFDARRQVDGIAAICELTEGLPLALELAAAWVRLLPCREIAAELSAGLEVLEPRSGGRSMRAAFDRSWQLASAHEREVLAALAVFPRDFSLDAAQAVAFARAASLAALADKSLLRSDPDGRYALHPLIRQCALERLVDADAARRRHAQYFSHWLPQQAHFGRVDQQRSVALVGADFSNCRAAFVFAAAQALHSAVARMAIPLWRFCELTGRAAEAHALFEEAAERLRAADEPGDDPQAALTRARVSCALAGLDFRLGRLEPGEMHARSAVELAQACGDARTAMVANNSLGLILWQRGALDGAAAALRQALRRARTEDDGASIRGITSNLTIVERMRGRLGRALALNRDVLAAMRAADDAYGTMRTLNNLGDLHRLRGEWETAVEHFEGALRVARDIGYAGYAPYFLVNLAQAHLGRGAVDDASLAATRALAAAREQRDVHNEASALGLLARVAIARGDHDGAGHLVDEAMKAARVRGRRCAPAGAHRRARRGAGRARAAPARGRAGVRADAARAAGRPPGAAPAARAAETCAGQGGGGAARRDGTRPRCPRRAAVRRNAGVTPGSRQWRHANQKEPVMTPMSALIVSIALTFAGGCAHADDVIVNDVRLDDGVRRTLERMYNVEIEAGRYWYDPVLGVWGRDGGPAVGIVHAGLPLGGPLRRDASRGNPA